MATGRARHTNAHTQRKYGSEGFVNSRPAFTNPAATDGSTLRSRSLMSHCGGPAGRAADLRREWAGGWALHDEATTMNSEMEQLYPSADTQQHIPD